MQLTEEQKAKYIGEAPAPKWNSWWNPNTSTKPKDPVPKWDGTNPAKKLKQWLSAGRENEGEAREDEGAPEAERRQRKGAGKPIFSSIRISIGVSFEIILRDLFLLLKLSTLIELSDSKYNPRNDS